MKSKSMFDELISNDFFDEKTASEEEKIAEGLEDISADTMEKLANEIGAICSDISMLEDKLASEDDEDEEKKDKKDESEEEKTSDDEENKDDKKEKKDNEDVKEKESEEESDKKDDSDKKDKEEEKEQTPEEKEVVKQAYIVAEQRLAKEGKTVYDYAISKCASDNLGCFIADKAEKLASITDNPKLQIVDDILNSISRKIQ